MLQLFTRATRVLAAGTTAAPPLQKTRLIAPSISNVSSKIANRLTSTLHFRSSPILWTRAASLSTSATTATDTTIDQDASKLKHTPRKRKKYDYYNWEWTPERDAQLLELRRTFTPWRQVSDTLQSPISYCAARYKALQNKDSKGYQIWSNTLETSTEHEKSIPQFQRLVVQGKTWGEIATIIGTTNAICQMQWSELGKRLAPKDITYFPAKAFRQLLEDPAHQLKRDEDPTTRSLLGVELYNWEKLSETLRSIYTPEYLQYRFLGRARFTTPWSPEDMEALRKFCQRSIKQLTLSSSSSSLPQETGPGKVDNAVDQLDWHHCSDQVFHGRHSAFDCRGAWITMTNPRMNLPKNATFPPWTVPEIMEYYEAWRKHGTDWAAIAKSIPSSPQPRSAENCSRAFMTLVKKAEELMATPKEEIDMTQTYPFPPKIPTPPFRWASEDVDKLKRVVQEELSRSEELERQGLRNRRYGMIRWEEVAKQLDNGTTWAQCWYLWTRKLKEGIDWDKPIVERKRLRPTNLKRLLELVEEERPQNSVEWEALKQNHFPEHVGADLRRLWAFTALPNLTQSRTRMAHLEKLFLQHGENWHQISATLSGSGPFTTTTLCKQAWKSRVLLTDPTWSPEEVNQLLQAADERRRQPIKTRRRTKTSDVPHNTELKSLRALEAKDWFEIGKLFYPSKSSVQCRAKWTEIKMPEEASDIQDIVPESLRWRSATASPLTKFSWTKERVEVLVKAIEKYGSSEHVMRQIADQLGSTKGSCVNRWIRYQRTGQMTSNKYCWDERRNKILFDTVAEFQAKGRSPHVAFHQVATILGDCSASQAQTRWKRLSALKAANRASNSLQDSDTP